MPWTKLDVIRQAFEEIGIASYEFDLQPEDLQSGLRQLDMMLASWSGTQGIRIGFSGGDGFGDVAQNAEVPPWAMDALYLNLALRLAPAYGKTPSIETKTAAKMALDSVRVRCVQFAPRKITGYAGAGSSWYGAVSVAEERSAVETGPDNTLEFGA